MGELRVQLARFKALVIFVKLTHDSSKEIAICHYERGAIYWGEFHSTTRFERIFKYFLKITQDLTNI